MARVHTSWAHDAWADDELRARDPGGSEVTGAATVALLVAGVLAAGDWTARARASRWLEYVCKPATLVALTGVAVALSSAPGAGARRSWFVVALVCSLAGDVVLMLPRDLFVPGLGAFLAGHLAYLVGFWTRPPGVEALAVAAVAAVVVVAPVGGRVLRALRARPPLLLPVALYMVVITAMLATALATGNVPAGAGAALFVASDAMIAWNRFVRPLRGADVAIMVTYHLGQAGLVLSLLR